MGARGSAFSVTTTVHIIQGAEHTSYIKRMRPLYSGLIFYYPSRILELVVNTYEHLEGSPDCQCINRDISYSTRVQPSSHET